MLDAGQDVTFLVRPGRAALLRAKGLIIKSPSGEVIIPHPPVLLAGEIAGPYDLVLLSCKAYDLDDAIASFAPAVGPHTMILPLLNGMAQIETLKSCFADRNVLGGLCAIVATLNDEGEIVQLQSGEWLKFGELGGGMSERVAQLSDVLATGNFRASASQEIVLDMWGKWVFLATLAATTCLMRASIGKILAATGGRDFILGVLDECVSVGRAAGHAPGQSAIDHAIDILTREGNPITASMMRDIDSGHAVEADHIIGNLIQLGEGFKVDMPRLRTAYTSLKIYEQRRVD